MLALLVVLPVTACSDEKEAPRPAPSGLEAYTDPDDGCPQAVSAIGYADFVLKPLGQEPYQDYSDNVRGRLSAVNGTISLEVKDFPSEEIREQAVRTGKEAGRAAERDVSLAERTRSLREYRRDAAQLVLLCAPYVDPKAATSS